MFRSFHRRARHKLELLGRFFIPDTGRFSEHPRRAKAKLKRIFRRRVRRRVVEREGQD